MWNSLLFCLVSGLAQGAIYSLVALGYTMVYGIIKLINFAHGEFCMVGAYAGWSVCFLMGEAPSPWLAIPAIFLTAGLAGAAVGGLTELIAYRPIRKASRFAALLTAIGVSFLLQKLAYFIRSGKPQAFPDWLDALAQHSLAVGSGGVKLFDLLSIPGAVLLAAGLWLIVHKTRLGRSMRAVSIDLNAAQLMGIRSDRVVFGTFVIGGFLGGLAGAFWGITAAVKPTMGFLPGLNAFVAAVLGGIGSIGGAMLGGFAIGIIQSLVVWAGVPNDYKDVASFVILILLLVLRPQGILGRPQPEKV